MNSKIVVGIVIVIVLIAGIVMVSKGRNSAEVTTEVTPSVTATTTTSTVSVPAQVTNTKPTVSSKVSATTTSSSSIKATVVTATTSQVITVTSPNAKIGWTRNLGDAEIVRVINWTRNFGHATAPVSVDLIATGTQSIAKYRLAESISSDGTINVTIKREITDGNYQIKICDIAKAICGSSDTFWLGPIRN